MKWECENGYTDQFDPNYRGTIGDRFCQAVRNGNEDVRSVLDAVSRDVSERDGAVWDQVARTLETTEAWDFAQHILDRESLPWEEKQKLKNAGRADNKHIRRAMAKDKPTEKQLQFLKSLHCPTVPKTKLEASDLIMQFKASRTLPKAEYSVDTPF